MYKSGTVLHVIWYEGDDEIQNKFVPVPVYDLWSWRIGNNISI